MASTNGTPSRTNGPLPLTLTDNQFRQLLDVVNTETTLSRDVFRRLLDPRRSIEDECGYPRTDQLSPEAYRDQFDRNPIANRVVSVLPRECWQHTPSVYEDEEAEVTTPFEIAWDELGQGLRGEASWYCDEEGHPLWEVMKRADILSRVGHFGVLLLGLDDGGDLMDPVEGAISYQPRKAVKEQDPALGESEEPETEEPLEDDPEQEEPAGNVFCPTGEGGGVDPTCSPYSGTLYHGTRAKELPSILVPGEYGKHKDAGNLGSGVYMTPDESLAHFYSGHDKTKILKLTVSLKRPLVLVGKKNEQAQLAADRLGVIKKPTYDGTIQTDHDWSAEFTTKAKAAGYDGVIWIDRKGQISEVVSFDPVPTTNGQWVTNTYPFPQGRGARRKGVRVRLVANGPRRPLMPDSPMSRDEEDRLLANRGLKTPLNEKELAVVRRWSHERSHPPPPRPTTNLRPTTKATTSDGSTAEDSWERAGKTMDSGIRGQDRQYYGAHVGLSEWVNPEASPKCRRLLFVRAFSEDLVQVVRYENNINNPRFGLPVVYRITLTDPRQTTQGIGLPTATVFVHWTRVIHLADNLTSSEVAGVPACRPVLNRLMDVEKVQAASAEGYWKSGVPGLGIETQSPDVDINVEAAKTAIENFQNSQQKYLLLQGLKATTIAPSVVDPTPFITTAIQAICIQIGVPQRVFMGSERGELASSQDDAAWNDRLRERQQTYITPRMIVPFVDRLILLGVLPEPECGYAVYWPDLDSLGEKDKADVGKVRTETMGTYIEKGVEAMMSPGDFYTKILGFSDEEATAIIDAACMGQQTTMTIPPEGMTGHPASEPPPPPLLPDGTPNPAAAQIDPLTGEPTPPPVGPGEQVAAPVSGPGDLEDDPTQNAFCPTGEGGGVDPTCSPKWSPQWEGHQPEDDEEGMGDVKYINLKDIYFPGGFGKEVAKLQDNGKMPIIVERTSKGYLLIDGWGRTSGMLNAGKEKIRAIIVTKGDIAERTTAGDDEEWNASMYEKYTNLEYRATTNHVTTRNTTGPGDLEDNPTQNVFCPTGEGGGIDPTCSPTGTHSPTQMKAKEERGKARVEALKQEARSIEVTTQVVTGGKIDRSDYDETESRMTDRERDRMSEELAAARDSWVDEQMAEYDASDEIDHREVADEAGWSRDDVAEKAEDLLKTHLGADHEDLDELSIDIEKWRVGSRKHGPDAVESLADYLDREGWVAKTVGHLDDLKAEAERDVNEKIEEYTESLNEDRRRQLEDEYDDGDAWRDYLRNFYDDHSDEPRFSGDRVEGVWGVDDDGDPTYVFSTSNGNEYDVWTQSVKLNGHPVLEVGFRDASGSHEITGAGGAHEVFTKVTTAITALVLRESPPILSFTAAEPSRQKLYDRLVRTTAAAAPRYAAVAIPLPDGGRRYVLIVRDELGRIEDMIPQGVSPPETLVNRRRPNPRGPK